MATSELSSQNHTEIQLWIAQARCRLDRFQITDLPSLEKWVDNSIATSKW
jgi:hypothetical protein